MCTGYARCAAEFRDFSLDLPIGNIAASGGNHLYRRHPLVTDHETPSQLKAEAVRTVLFLVGQLRDVVAGVAGVSGLV